MKFFVIKKNAIVNFLICLIVCAFTVCGIAFSNKYVVADAPIYNGSSDSNAVALMFNCYEGAEQVERILETLENNNAKATFFIGGCWAKNNIDVINKIIEKGHEVGNHGYLHKDHKTLNEVQNEQEIMQTHKLIKENCNVEMNLFAPPSGSYNKLTVKVAENCGYKTIMWSRDTIDWRDNDAETLFSRATKNINAGEMVLMHPKSHTADVLDKIVKEILSKGLELKTVSEVNNF